MKLHSLILIVIAATLLGCKTGSVLVEQSEQLETLKNEIKRSDIFYFEPIISSYYIRDNVENQYLTASKYKGYVNTEVLEAGRKNGFKVTILDAETSKSQYPQYSEELLQLKSSIVNAMALQANDLNYGRKVSGGYLQKGVFVHPPRISSEFSHLSSTFSPFFAVTGIFAVDAEPSTFEARSFVRKNRSFHVGQYYYFYHILINIQTSEIVYREIKKVPFRLSRTYLTPIIYDSYALLNQTLK